MHNIFHMSLLEQDTTRKKRVDKRLKELELKAGNSKEYKVEAIWNSAVYANKSESGQLPGLLPNSMEKIPWERKYLRTIICSSAPKKADQFLLQKSPGETNSDFSFYQFRFADG